MKRRALFSRPLFHGRELTEKARVSLLVLGLAALLLTAGLAGRGFTDRPDGESPPAGAELPAPAPAAVTPQEEEQLAPALAEDDPAEGLSRTEAEAEAGETEDAVDAVEEDRSEDGQAPGREPAIDLRRLITGELAVIRPYGYDFNPNTEDYRFHRGSDLAAAAGRPVFAPAAGTVREAAEDAYWGGVLIIDHEGWTTVLRCVTPRVESGTRVQAGDFIASVAPAPAEAAEESHFHVEVEREGSSLDPLFYF
ncbi:MAG: M23 family metallopeptidase [Firmicutes bacterium]|nr:M23 family metallopeptidase [Bacillota bacterium]